MIYDPNSSKLVVDLKWIISNQAAIVTAITLIGAAILSLISSLCAIAIKIIPILRKNHPALPLVKVLSQIALNSPTPTDAQRVAANPEVK
jgi:hypothetical protein